MNRRTRIVATLGPATDRPDMLRKMLKAGVNVARINFSHGSAAEHLARIELLRSVSASLGLHVAVLADLPGPKLRVLTEQPLELIEGEELVIDIRDQPELSYLRITEPEILRETQTGHRVLLDDGRLQLEVTANDGQFVRSRIIVGGVLLPNKGLNLPDTKLTIPALTDRDRQALAIAAQAQVDWLALSFVRNAAAASELREEAALHSMNVPILAKMERPEAIENAAAIIAAFDGIMVARGDLGVEIPLERVPTVQKQLISLARIAGKPVVTATDMLDSMRDNPRPTRAEASDVANAIYDGTDAIMLSGETAVGKHPHLAVECMSQIAIEAEKHLKDGGDPVASLKLQDHSIDDHVTELVVTLAERVKADAIITPTLSGRTARLLARHRPNCTVIAPAPSEQILRQMAIVWGLEPVLMDYCRRIGDDRISGAVESAFEAGKIEAGQLVVVLAGHPVEGGEYVPTIRLTRVNQRGQAIEPEVIPDN
ncbi:MAG: pyruvate kinase [Zavarzinella sp.]